MKEIEAMNFSALGTLRLHYNHQFSYRGLVVLFLSDWELHRRSQWLTLPL